MPQELTIKQKGIAMLERTPPAKNAQEAISEALKYVKPKSLAELLKVDDAHIYRGRKGDITPTLQEALITAGLIPPPKKRKQTRLAATVTPEERKALQQLAAMRGMTWSEYCKSLVR